MNDDREKLNYQFIGLRTFLFLKKPYGVAIPPGLSWTCGCGNAQELRPQDLSQNCNKCGARLKIQERRDSDPERQGSRENEKFTLIRVAHITIKSQNGEEEKKESQ